jgi:hypothetical protein
MPITQPTVLILGAGASHPYGFPLGSDLRDKICDHAADFRYSIFLKEFGFSDGHVTAFRHALQHSGFSSIDAFLDAEPRYTAIGKLAIALALLPLEQHSRLFPPTAPRNGHWYQYLLNLMSPGKPGWERNRLTILTFNYDRSLEHYFCTVLAQRLRSDPIAAAKAFKQIEVIHLHGQLGCYPRLGGKPVPYGNRSITVKQIRRAAEGIRTIAQEHDLRPFAKAGKRLTVAKRIFFLGFGFAGPTMDRLARYAPDCLAPIGGTSRGLGDRDWARVTGRYFKGQWLPRSRRSVLEFLRSDVNLEYNPDPRVRA